MNQKTKTVSKEEYISGMKRLSSNSFISIFLYSTFIRIQNETNLSLEHIVLQHQIYLSSKESREDISFYDYFFGKRL